MASRRFVASLFAAVVASSIGFVPAAFAQGGAKPNPPKGAAAPAPAPAVPAGPLKDPENKKGLSPYMELIAKGEAAFVARDFPGAVSAFQEAIKLDGQKMLGFYRLGEAQLASNKPEEAEAVWTAALS